VEQAVKGIIVFLMITMTAFTACGGESAAGNERVTVNEKYEYYEITGSTESELRQQMGQKGIKWDDGKTYDALTTWNVTWQYDYDCELSGCTAEDFKATVNIVFRYPQWVRDEAGAPEPLMAKWENYMNNLIVHEVGHRNMAVDAVAQMAAAVTELPGTPSRSELDRAVEALTRERMAKMNSEQRTYDDTTIHGTTQGAVFP
jgi:predicted secreted Zn-dependent protease